MPTPNRDIEITVALAHRLLDDQQPDLGNRTLVVAGEGWDNVMITLGEDLAMRLPRRFLANDLVRNEQRWLPFIQTLSSIPLPVPVWDGSPTNYYPYTWSVVPWFRGTRASQVPLSGSQVGSFASFLRNLHVRAPGNAPQNAFRNRPLTAYGGAVERRLSVVESAGIDLGVKTATVRATWNDLKTVAIDAAPTWVHGDLHPNNVITNNGVVVAVVDWGDVTTGDVSVDLSSVWSLFEPSRHNEFWNSYGPVTRSTRDRARAWAIHFALMWIVDAAEADPAFGTMARNTLGRLFSSEGNRS